MYRDIMFIHDIISINTLHLSMGKYVESVQIALEECQQQQEKETK